MPYSKITYAVEHGVAVLELADPPANTCSHEMMREIDAAVLDARMDREVHVRRLTPPSTASAAVGRIKRAVHSGLDAGLHEGLALERELQQLLFQSDDAREGLTAHVEKRPPRFSGR
jgi:enoyl-CoA hydratase/carnithine racemase